MNALEQADAYIGPRFGREDLFIELSDGSRWYPGRDNNTVSIENLAHSLSNLCRFTGHCGTFYSIAEHSVKVSYLVPTLTGLMHDAHEALTNDLSKPVKIFLAGSYAELESRAETQIARQYHLEFPHGPVVKEADIVMCLIEAFDLLPSKGKSWGYYEAMRPKAMNLYIERPELRAECWSPQKAYSRFMLRYHELAFLRDFTDE